MNDVPVCGLCPALLFEPDSIATGRCYGCRWKGVNERPTFEDIARMNQEPERIVSNALIHAPKQD